MNDADPLTSDVVRLLWSDKTCRFVKSLGRDGYPVPVELWEKYLQAQNAVSEIEAEISELPDEEGDAS